MAVAQYAAGAPRPKAEKVLVRTLEACRYYHVGGTVVKAVDQVTWEVVEGRLYTLRGRSGSGKTTLLNLIGALDKATSGQVFFDGRDLGKAPERELTMLRRHRMGFVFQTFALLPILSAYENVELTLRIGGMGARERRDRTIDVLELVGLGQRMNHRPFELSGGEQQRVSIARALANRPSLLIADEPTGELDSVTGLEIMMLFRSIVDNEGITVAMATHDPALSQFADETFLIEDGRLSKAVGALDFDLPDLVQHIEIVGRDRGAAGPAQVSDQPAPTAHVAEAAAEPVTRVLPEEPEPAPPSPKPKAEHDLFRRRR